MLETLLGQIKGVLGKSYLLAGLLPGAVVFFGVEWFRHGMDGLRRAATDLRQNPDQIAANVVLGGLLLLGVGLLFFALRGAILQLLQTGPGVLGERLVGRQRGRWRKDKRLIEERLWEHTALMWAGGGFNPSTYFPPWLPKGEDRRAEVERLSQQARATLETVRGEERYAEQGEADDIVKGLRELRAFAAGAYGPPAGAEFFDHESAEWKTLLGRERAKEIIESLANDVHRQFARGHERLHSSFPLQEQWVQATELGNRFAALDDYAERRYNIDTSTLWTRLWGVLTADERREVSDAQLTIEVFTNLCAAFALLAAVALMLVAIDTVPAVSAAASCYLPRAANDPAPACSTPPFNWRSLVVPASFVLAFLFYKGAIFAFGGLAEKMKRHIDLRRLQLLQAFGYDSPKTIGEERRFFGELSAFFAQAEPLPEWRRLNAPKKPAESAAKQE